jgi:hypothetical protein
VTVRVVYTDLGLKDLPARVERELEEVCEQAATAVGAQMAMNIVDRGFFDTGATANSVGIRDRRRLERDIGPTTEYAIYGEMGWSRETSMYTASFPGLHFARDALRKVGTLFVREVAEAVKRATGG